MYPDLNEKKPGLKDLEESNELLDKPEFFLPSPRVANEAIAETAIKRKTANFLPANCNIVILEKLIAYKSKHLKNIKKTVYQEL